MKKLVLFFAINTYAITINLDSNGDALKVFLDHFYKAYEGNYSVKSQLLAQPFYGRLEGEFTKDQMVRALKAVLRTNNLMLYNGPQGVHIITDLNDTYYERFITIDTLISIKDTSLKPDNLGLVKINDSQYRFTGLKKDFDLINQLRILPQEEKPAPRLAYFEVIEILSDSVNSVGIDLDNSHLSISIGGRANFFNLQSYNILDALMQHEFYEKVSSAELSYKPKFSLSSTDTIEFFFGGEQRIESSSFTNDNGLQKQYTYKETGIELKVYPVRFKNDTLEMKFQIDNTDIIAEDQYSKKSFKGVQTFRSGNKKLIASYTGTKKIIEEDRIPFLSSIPIIGQVFSGRKESKKYVQHFIFCTVLQ